MTPGVRAAFVIFSILTAWTLFLAALSWFAS